MKKLLSTTAATFVLTMGLASGAFAGDTEDFVKKASMSNLFEIESSKLAQQKAQKTSVKNFANKMILDHTQAGNDLKSAVGTADIDPSLVATKLDKDHQEKLNDLRNESAEDFDAAYMEAQEDLHDTAISLFEDYAESGENAQLKQFATKTLPVLQSHEDMTDKLD